MHCFPWFFFLFLLTLICFHESPFSLALGAEYKYLAKDKIAFMSAINEQNEAHLALCISFNQGWVGFGIGEGMKNATVFMVATNSTQYRRSVGVTTGPSMPTFDSYVLSIVKTVPLYFKMEEKKAQKLKCYHFTFPYQNELFTTNRPLYQVGNLSMMYAFYEGEMDLTTKVYPSHQQAGTFEYEIKTAETIVKLSQARSIRSTLSLVSSVVAFMVMVFFFVI